MKAVEKIQRRATKLVPTIKDLPYEERLRHLRLPSLLHRRRRGDMIQMYKIVKDVVDVDKKLFTNMQESTTTRGHNFKLRKTKATKHSRINVFSNRVIDDWNSLPSTVVNAKTTDSFKKEIDEHWANKMYKTPF